MNILRTSTFRRSFIVAAMLLSWLFFTNHCALAAMQTQHSNDTVPCCQEKELAPVEGAPCEELAECCAVKASLSGKIETPCDTSKVLLQVRAGFDAIGTRLLPAVSAANSSLDRPPPRCVSFAESVLQRSLLSHAPPATA